MTGSNIPGPDSPSEVLSAGGAGSPLPPLPEPDAAQPTPSRIRTHHLQQFKAKGEHCAMLTAYDQYTAEIFDEAGIEVLLVGDSASNKVKIEGGSFYADTVRSMVQAGIPVIAYIGFTPQSEHSLGATG